MDQETITITREEYEELKKAAEIDMELVRKIRRSLEDVKEGRIKEWPDH